jgi:hypothetical protein
MVELKGVAWSRTQLIDDLGNRRTYWDFKVVVENLKKVEKTVYHINLLTYSMAQQSLNGLARPLMRVSLSNSI